METVVSKTPTVLGMSYFFHLDFELLQRPILMIVILTMLMDAGKVP